MKSAEKLITNAAHRALAAVSRLPDPEQQMIALGAAMWRVMSKLPAEEARAIFAKRVIAEITYAMHREEDQE